MEKALSLNDLPQRQNLLPRDGIVTFFRSMLTDAQVHHYLHALQENIDWKNDEVVIFGKRHVTGRKVAWYGDNGFEYTYSGKTKRALPWTDELMQLRALVERETGLSFNSCLLNLYHHGDEGMGWHSDDEPTLGRNPAIASLSLGAARPFDFRHRITKEKVSVMLESGSLLLMAGETQHHWVHALPKSRKIKDVRINLTFRLFQNNR